MPTSNREIADLKKQVRELTARLAEMGEEQVDDMSDQAIDFMAKHRGKADAWAEALRDQGFEIGKRAKHMAKNSEEFAEENPWKVAAGALAVGVIAGLFLSRRD